MNARSLILRKLKRAWAHLTFQYGIATAACAWAVWMHYQYRLQGSWIFLALPMIGIVLLALNVLMIVNEFATSLPQWDPVRCLLKRMECSAGLLVRLFVYSSLLWYANGMLDNKPPIYRSAVIDSEAWKPTTGLPVPYSWVTLRYRDNPEATTMVLITWEERGKLWGAQPVSVTLKNGLLGIPTVTAIEQDWGWFGNEILKLAPTATMIAQRKIDFDLTHDRWSEGIDAASRYLELNQNDWETAILAGSLLFEAAHYHDSLPFLEHAVKQRQTYENMQRYGLSLNWAGQSVRAAEVFQTSIPLDPHNWEAYYHLGYVYGDMGQYEEAIGYFEETLKRQPASLEAKAMIAKHRKDIALRDTQKRSNPTKLSSSSTH
ncbi:MAG: tetratricopeptide repeat protein [Nitrospira sp. CG24E]|nr:MAG: tetratricopeptide repeat protein [Nitrospira sp. CG24E]